LAPFGSPSFTPHNLKSGRLSSYEWLVDFS